MAKAPLGPERTLKTPLPQQGSPSAREEEGHWVLMEDRRRRSTAFEKVAKKMLRYPDNSDDVKVGITELQERLGMSEKVCISVLQVRKWPNKFRNLQARRRLGQVGRTAERSGQFFRVPAF